MQQDDNDLLDTDLQVQCTLKEGEVIQDVLKTITELHGIRTVEFVSPYGIVVKCAVESQDIVAAFLRSRGAEGLEWSEV